MKKDNIKLTTHKFKIRKGIDDLISPFNDFGEFIGCGLLKDAEEYFRRKEYYDKLIKDANDSYIKNLKEKGEYGEEVLHKLQLKENLLYDSQMRIPKPAMESYKIDYIVFDSIPEIKEKDISKAFSEQGTIYFNNNMKTTEEQIKHVKQLRVEIDRVTQEVINDVVNSREKSIAITKLQEAKMWLGQVLANFGATTPYPHANNPDNAIVEPTADTYSRKEFKKQYFQEPSNESYVSIHFTMKNQELRDLKNSLKRLAGSKDFDFTKQRVIHCFLPIEEVKRKGLSTILYDKLLYPYFNKLICYNRGSDLSHSRKMMLQDVKQSDGVAIFIGELIDGVKEEYDLAKELGVNILHIENESSSKERGFIHKDNSSF